MSPLALPRRWIYRYPLLVRASHWLNVVCLVIFVMSGLQIFNAHPALYWGEVSDFDDPLLSISLARTEDGRPIGVTQVFGRRFDTTGILGWSRANGRPVQRAFPAWLTLPSVQDLATGRVWHFFFAWLFVLNGLVYVSFAIASSYLSQRLLPSRHDWRAIGLTFRNHVLLRFRHFTDDASYNVLQKLTYFGVTFLLAPLVILTGLTMSPAIDAAVPWLPEVFGGRQSARTLHFAATGLFLLFAIVHVAMVTVTGVWTNLRAMITGWYGARRGAV